jgi:hypothetical protein
VKFLEAINPHGERESYCASATQEIWNVFAKHFEQYPMQWESIYFMHQFRAYSNTNKVHTLNTSETYIFNSNRYEFYSMKQGKAVFDSYNGKSIKLPGGYLDFLYKLHSKNIELEGHYIEGLIKNKDSINALFSNEFLVNNKIAI